MPGMNLLEEKRVGESISKHVWISLTGPAVGSLKHAFFGPSVKVLQKSTKEKGVTTQAEEEECTANEAGRGEMTPRTADNIKPQTESPTMIVMAGTTAGAQKYIKVQQMYRIVLLGDTRAGKSSLANTMFGEDVFKGDNTECQAESKSVHGRRITLINTPDLFSPGRSEEELKPEILRCITEFPPGPHAFLIVLKVDKSTEQQQEAVIEKICQYFPEEAFKYAAVVFTQDDSEGMKIQDFIDKNKCLSDLVKKCKSRFHTINNYKQQGDNISNQSQVAELLNTIKQIVEENKGRCYTSKMLPQGDTCSNTNELIKLTGPAAESVAKAFSGPAFVVLTQGTTNEAEESNKTTDKEGQNGEETASETANKGDTEKNTKEDGETIKENKGEEVAEETEGNEDDKDGIICGTGQDQRPKDTEEKREEEATPETVGELRKESQEKTEGNEDDKDGIIREEEQNQRPKETEEEREEEAASEVVGEPGKESQEKTEGKDSNKHGIICETGQDQRPKETEEKAEDRSQEEKILGHRQAAGGIAPAVGAVAAGFIVAAGAAGAAGAGGAAGAAEATAAGAGAAGAGSAAGSVGKVAIAIGGAIGVGLTIKKAINWVTNWVKPRVGVVLLVLVFYSLLLSWFFLEVPFVGTLFLLFLLLLLVIILVVI
ncbi:uncharacterized protein LOC115797358 isoform X2 [Archocentrus centrarchus]|uniref:uncharacterized protein LOC115797358 isoform X2 n=1 Tax=Archocentrus centrarchus TaxID=63155 RepID=UPI0011EA31B8|nr:uncharacterized protein LOC115797358 isoform X2 [Archocentrus centrarchus]